MQGWRSKEREDALRQQVLSNVHAPAKVRGNGPLGNIPDFYTAFGVKPGDLPDRDCLDGGGANVDTWASRTPAITASGRATRPEEAHAD